MGFIDNWETCLEKSAKDGIHLTLDGAAVVSRNLTKCIDPPQEAELQFRAVFMLAVSRDVFHITSCVVSAGHAPLDFCKLCAAAPQLG